MNNNFLISLLLFLFISNILAQGVDEESCPENEVPTPCVPCEGNCSNPNPVCIQVCIERNETICRCRDGYVRENGTCIRLDQCPNSNITCGKNELPTNCLPCEGNCSNPNPICPLAICIPINDTVCRCRDGYVRENGTCIRKDQCDNANSTCPKNEVPTPCVPCEGTCSNPNPICPLICIESNDTMCRCRNGYVRENGTCIRLDQCENTCGPNEVPTTCRPCEGTCSNPNPICPRICIEPDPTHCRCRNGYVREDDECIPEETCPSTSTTSPTPE